MLEPFYEPLNDLKIFLMVILHLQASWLTSALVSEATRGLWKCKTVHFWTFPVISSSADAFSPSNSVFFSSLQAWLSRTSVSKVVYYPRLVDNGCFGKCQRFSCLRTRDSGQTKRLKQPCRDRCSLSTPEHQRLAELSDEPAETKG